MTRPDTAYRLLTPEIASYDKSLSEAIETGGPIVLNDTIPMMPIGFKPVTAKVRAPLAPAIYGERTLMPTTLVEMTAESSAKLVGPEPVLSINVGNPRRAFPLKNLEAPGKFSGKGTPILACYCYRISGGT